MLDLKNEEKIKKPILIYGNHSTVTTFARLLG